MSDKRYQGNIISKTPVAPANAFEDTPAPGVWSLAEALAYTKAGLWPSLSNGIASIGLFMGGVQTNGSRTDTINKVIVQTTGTTSDYGDLTETKYSGATGGNTTRAVYMGGTGDTGYETGIDYLTYATGGTASSFGSLATGSSSNNQGQLSNNVRTIAVPYTSGYNPPATIRYINPATTGNDVEFGTLGYTTNIGMVGSCSSSVRGIISGGYNNSTYENTIHYIDIVTGGTSVNFGDLTVQVYSNSMASSATRGVSAGGILQTGGGTWLNTIDYITIASTGNATDFGDLTVAKRYIGTASSPTVGLFAGGTNSSSTNIQTIDAINFASTGNATDFGSSLITSARNSGGACNNMAAVQVPATSSAMAFATGARNSGDNGYSSSISFYNIATTGNGSQFGEMRTKRSETGNIGGATRQIFISGRDHDTAIINEIDYIETSNQGGTASDFGDLATNAKGGATFGNSTRGIQAGGDDGAQTNVIQYLTISSTGNMTDFGDLLQRLDQNAGCASPTRGISGGGRNTGGDGVNEIQYVTIASIGNATDFGDLTTKRYGAGSCSSSTRGLIASGNDGAPNYTNLTSVDYITIASTGNAADFGDLNSGGLTGTKVRGASSETRGTFIKSSSIGYVTIASLGNSTDFGDLPGTSGETWGVNSNAHGGLQ